MVQALEEYLGRMRTVSSLTTNLLLHVPSGPGGERFYDLNPTGTRTLTLPDARGLKTGLAYRIYNRSSAQTLLLNTNTGTQIQAISGGEFCDVMLLSNATIAGQWLPLLVPAASVIRSPNLSLSREPWTISLSGVRTGGIVLRDYINALGYSGVSPVALVVDVAANTIIGGLRSPATSAITSGEFPANSTMLLINRGIITGYGGNGGTGGASASGLGGAATNGGDAILISSTALLRTNIVNWGAIQGGGGGGGGGAGTATVGGGGGGGGAGHPIGNGGGIASGSTARTGTNGSTSYGGPGGSGGTNGNAGGTGGAPGSSGSSGAGASGGALGAAGLAVKRRLGTLLSITNEGAGVVYGSATATY
jgi:hypothetical protein